MRTIPDAPWIREAEMNGMPPCETVKCPCCEEECETIYADQYGNVFACNKCLQSADAWEWLEEEKKRDREE